jgi:hypothetical protein
MLSLEVRKRSGGAEVHRLGDGTITVGASSGNEVVVRARGVAGRHVRILQNNGEYQLDLYRGVDAVTVNGRPFSGGRISPGDRIAIGEATIIVLNGRASASAPREIPVLGSMEPATSLGPTTDVEFRTLRLEAYALCRQHSGDDLAAELVDFMDRALPPSEWATGEFTASIGFRPLASTFRENPALPPRMIEDVRLGERMVRTETVTGVLTLFVEPRRGEQACFALLVREDPRLSGRAVLFLEELVQLAGIARRSVAAGAAPEPPRVALPVEMSWKVDAEGGPAETTLRESDDLKKIIETVEREVIDRTMRRLEGNQSRASEVLNISRGSLIAKLKEYEIPDYRYLRRERTRK